MLPAPPLKRSAPSGTVGASACTLTRTTTSLSADSTASVAAAHALVSSACGCLITGALAAATVLLPARPVYRKQRVVLTSAAETTPPLSGFVATAAEAGPTARMTGTTCTCSSAGAPPAAASVRDAAAAASPAKARQARNARACRSRRRGARPGNGKKLMLEPRPSSPVVYYFHIGPPD